MLAYKRISERGKWPKVLICKLIGHNIVYRKMQSDTGLHIWMECKRCRATGLGLL